MKKICLALTLSCFISMTYAQTNTIDIGFYGLFLRTINLSYEKAITKNQSFQIKGGYTIPRSIPDIFLAGDDLTTDPDVDGNFSGFSVVGEYRFYIKKEEALRGFYVAPYLKFHNYSVEFTERIGNIPSTATGGCNTFSLGGQLGYQWLVSDKFVVDLGFLGLGISRNALAIKYETSDPNVDFEQFAKDVQTAADSWRIVSRTVKTEIGDDHVKAKVPFMGLNMRFNLGLGYAF